MQLVLPERTEALACRLLSSAEAFDVVCAYTYENEDALTTGLLSAGGVGEAAGEGEPEVRAALLDVLEPFRTPGGGYRLENTWHVLLARA